jgi:PAS domain S-box-containing protein
LTSHVFVWLLVVLTLSLLVMQLRHRRIVAAEIKEGVADARDILDSSDEGIVVTASSGKIIRFNRMAETIFGYQAAYVMGRDFLVLLPDALHAAHQHTMSGSAPTAASQSHECMARRADGTLFPIHLTVKPTRQLGRLVYLGMFRDISVRKLAEASSRSNRQMMEFLLNSSPIVFYTANIGAGDEFTYVSPNVEEIFGYKADAITGASAFLLRHVHPDDREQVHLGRSVQSVQVRKQLEYRLKMPRGDYRWVSDSHTLINDDNGDPNLLIGRWTDIHERKVSEIELALKEESLNISLRCAGLATWCWTINSGEMSWSERISDMLGHTGEQLTDFDDFSAVIHPEDRDTLTTRVRHCLVNDEALDLELKIQWADNSNHWIHLTGELISDEYGSPVRMVGALTDITAQKQLRVAPSRHAKLA